MPTAFVTHPDYLLHTLPGHPEHAGRLERVNQVLAEHQMDAHLLQLKPELAGLEQIKFVHRPEHIEQVRTVSARGGHLDPDTYTTPQSYDVALLSAGGATLAVDAVMGGEADNAFAALRPPGHHATPTRSMGFCLFNNIAIAARHAQQGHGLERVMIIDFDVHHGNGTQDAFYDDDSVLFVSSHQYPYYPGTGALDDLGVGKGRGYTVNAPLPAGAGNAAFRALYERVVWPIARRFKPELLLVSAGFDAHWQDPLAGIRLDLESFAHLTRELKAMAGELCEGRVIFIMEGGYNLEALAYGVLNVLHVLLGHDTIADPLGSSGDGERPVEAILDEMVRLHQLT